MCQHDAARLSIQIAAQHQRRCPRRVSLRVYGLTIYIARTERTTEWRISHRDSGMCTFDGTLLTAMSSQVFRAASSLGRRNRA